MQKNGKYLLMVVILINLMTLIGLFGSNFGNLLFNITHYNIFDYYITYIYSLIIFDIYTIFYLSYEKYKKNKLEIYKFLGGESFAKKKLDFKGVPYIFSIEGYITQGLNGGYNFDNVIEHEVKTFFELSYDQVKKIKDIRLFFDLGQLFEIIFGGIIAIFSFILLVIILSNNTNEYNNSLFAKISVNNFVSKYENKYIDLKYELENKKEQTALKEATKNKLINLKNQYITDFGTGSDIVIQIDNDIKNIDK